MSDPYDPIRIRVAELVSDLGAMVAHLDTASEDHRHPSVLATDRRVTAEALKDACDCADYAAAKAADMAEAIAALDPSIPSIPSTTGGS